MTIQELNHVALHVADLAKSVDFYRRVLLLDQIPRPAFSFPGAWLRLGKVQELHLIANRTEPVASHHRGNHFALQVDSLSEWEAHLEALGLAAPVRKMRPDGAAQLFLHDPDGHVVELFTPAADRGSPTQCH